jgi:predicted SnoaL-like aldol condensation-catalyzing enzyme
MSTAPGVTSIEQNKQLILRWFEQVWNHGNRDTIAQLFAPNAVLYDGSVVIRGPAEFEAFFDSLRAQFSSFQITPVVILAEGDMVAIRWNAAFKHTPTDRPAAVTGISIARVKDGKFVEAWQNWDAAALAAQLA